MQELSLRAGWINGFQNDRKYVGDYVTPGGVQIEAHVQKWNFGIHNTFYAGDNLMPYYVAPFDNLDYGPGLYWGESRSIVPTIFMTGWKSTGSLSVPA